MNKIISIINGDYTVIYTQSILEVSFSNSMSLS